MLAILLALRSVYRRFISVCARGTRALVVEVRGLRAPDPLRERRTQVVETTASDARRAASTQKQMTAEWHGPAPCPGSFRRRARGWNRTCARPGCVRWTRPPSPA